MRRDLLAAWLATHTPADEVEAAHTATVLDALAGEPDPFDRATSSPGHVTASAFVLSPDDAAVALILHRGLGRWLQPGGHCDPGDADIVDAARREVAEETGLVDVALLPGFPRLLDVDVHTIPARPERGEAAHLHLDVRLLFRAPTSDLRSGHDVDAARWVPLDQVPSIGADASVLRALERVASRRGASPVVAVAPPPRVEDARIDEVLRFWFGEDHPPTAERQASWWRHDAALDAEVTARFSELHAQAVSGDLDAWVGTPRGRLAVVVVLDQLSRHLHRDTPGMFASDAAAVALALQGVADGELDQLTHHERMFLLMPLVHAEDRRLQAASVGCFRQLAADARRAGVSGLDGGLYAAIAHRRIVERFGRFPHRNAILGRPTTPEEEAFLREPGSSF